MNLSNATKQQLKNIIEWDNHCPTLLLSQVYEEAIEKEVHAHFIGGCIIKYFRSIKRAEELTKLTIDELKWLCYEKGFEALKKFQPGNRPFIALWSIYIKRCLRDAVRTYTAQKRSAEFSHIDEIGDWILPPAHANTETTAINRVFINTLFEKMTDTEKEIVLMRYAGYTLEEVAAKQNVTKSGIQRRIQTCVNKLKDA